MKNIDFSKVITANNLLTGEVVYLTKSGHWSLNHGDAVLISDKSAASARLVEVQGQDMSVVGPYLADATCSNDNAPMPVHFREVFRTKGPSNRLIGKQSA